MMFRSGCTMVKNTFIELADEAPTQDGWRRQVSDPVSPMNRFSSKGSSNSPSAIDVRDNSKESSNSTKDMSGGSSKEPCGLSDSGEGTPKMNLEYRDRASTVTSQLSFFPDPPMLHDPDVKQHTSLTKPIIGAGHGESKSASSSRRNLNRLKDNDVAKLPPPWTDVTTVMMRNLPNRYSQQRLLDELRENGFIPRKHFDFFYLPMDHSNAANLGYCFLNFTETGYANAFAETFMGRQMMHFKSSKTVVVMAASIQGYEKNYAYYSSTRVVLAEDAQYRPLFFRDGHGAGSKSGAQAKTSASGQGKKNAKQGDVTLKKKRTTKERVSKAAPSNLDVAWPTDASSDALGTWSKSTDASSGIIHHPPPYASYPEQVSGAAACIVCGRDQRCAHRFCTDCGGAVLPRQAHAWASVNVPSLPMTPQAAFGPPWTGNAPHESPLYGWGPPDAAAINMMHMRDKLRGAHPAIRVGVEPNLWEDEMPYVVY